MEKLVKAKIRAGKRRDQSRLGKDRDKKSRMGLMIKISKLG